MPVKNKYMVCSNAINKLLKIRVVKTTEEDKKFKCSYYSRLHWIFLFRIIKLQKWLKKIKGSVIEMAREKAILRKYLGKGL